MNDAFDFRVETEQAADGISVLAVSGEVDLFTAPELKVAAQQALDAGATRLVVDLTATRFLDSTALGVLIGLVKRVRPLGGDLTIVNTDPTTAKTFTITGLDEIFTVVATRDDAIAALAG
ncbi:STAS domain-containing protein [Paraconexibacter algicola]|uniref:Anti-sigma factor antagonist n=1 Tax=Paraconexibacter algicola TaxID=2133960 RepID=A0A2T4UGG5_9ACTN|nr:STAS domain-containing protein [Paraconexibacter algicola]PTL58326.1 anti-sigma B factor antagonist [Paraconexibacter algicola]